MSHTRYKLGKMIVDIEDSLSDEKKRELLDELKLWSKGKENYHRELRKKYIKELSSEEFRDLEELGFFDERT